MRIKAILIGLFCMGVGGFIILCSFVVEPTMRETAALGLLAVIVGPLVAWWGFDDLTKRGGAASDAASDVSDLLG